MNTIAEDIAAATAARKREDAEILAGALAAQQMAVEAAEDRKARQQQMARDWEMLPPTLPVLTGATDRLRQHPAQVLVDEFDLYMRAGQQANGQVVTQEELASVREMLCRARGLIHVPGPRFWLVYTVRASESSRDLLLISR